MKSLLPLLFLALVGALSAQLPDPRGVVEAEYFWDVDPGEGSGLPMPALDGALDESVEGLLQNGIVLPAEIGPHTFNVRVKDANADWSAVFTTVVEVLEDGVPTVAREMKVVEAEYFWDVDPGQGSGTPMLAKDGLLDEAVEELFAMGIALPLGVGAHTFNVRVRDVDNNWSAPFITVVHQSGPPTPSSSIRDVGLVEAEYFWDVDPGQGSGMPMIAEDASFDESVERMLANMVGLPVTTGPHSFNVRVRDVDGSWSGLFTTVVQVVVPTATVDLPNAQLVEAEYFWDVDPGQGNGSPMLAVDGALDEVVESVFQLGIAAPANYGPHTFSVRTRDGEGNWSPVFTTVVYHVIEDGTGMPDLFGDIDKDGLDNLTEYYLGSRPLVPDSFADYFGIEVREEAGLGPGKRGFYEVNRRHVAPDVRANAEVSSDLVIWFNELDGDVAIWSESPSQVIYYATDPIDRASPLFFRLNLEYVPVP